MFSNHLLKVLDRPIDPAYQGDVTKLLSVSLARDLHPVELSASGLTTALRELAFRSNQAGAHLYGRRRGRKGSPVAIRQAVEKPVATWDGQSGVGQ